MGREFGSEFIKSATSRIGAPFAHHFKPDNVCEGGRLTTESCMQRGMDPSGYDCSGLVIASLCDVLGITTNTWPQGFRHAQQLKGVATDIAAEPGDIRVYFSPNGRIHIGIATASEASIHASGISKTVEKSIVRNKDEAFLAIQAIQIESLRKILTQ